MIPYNLSQKVEPPAPLGQSGGRYRCLMNSLIIDARRAAPEWWTWAEKEVTRREAVARGRLEMAPETLNLILAGGLPKGDVLGTARIAGVMAAKQCANLIPMCHPLRISSVEIDFSADETLGMLQHRGRRARARQNGRGDGSPDRRERGRSDRLRHVQGGGQGYGALGNPADEEDGWKERGFHSGRRVIVFHMSSFWGPRA